jgi:hypothetical protein
VVNHKRTFRLYSEEGLQVRTKRRKKLYRPRVPMSVPTGINERWSVDFVSDQLANGRRFRVRMRASAWPDKCGRVGLAGKRFEIPLSASTEFKPFSRLPIFVATDVKRGPIARALLPLRILAGFHGTWVGA